MCQEEWKCDSLSLTLSGTAPRLFTCGLQVWASEGGAGVQSVQESWVSEAIASAQNMDSVPRAGHPQPSPLPITSNNGHYLATTVEGKGDLSGRRTDLCSKERDWRFPGSRNGHNLKDTELRKEDTADSAQVQSKEWELTGTGCEFGLEEQKGN